MLRTIVSLVFTFIFLTMNAQASFTAPVPNDWTHIRTLGDYRVYHKQTYINIVTVKGQKRLSTWAKYVARDTKPNMFYLKKDDFVMVQLQFICSTRQYAIVSGTTYLSQGRVSRSSFVDQPHFIQVQPKSIEARIADRVCKDQA